MESTKRSRLVATILLTVFAVVALAGAIAVIVSTFDGDTANNQAAPENSPELSESAEPYRADLIQAAQQCPTVLTAQRLDRYIDEATGWDANWQDQQEIVVVKTVSVAGLTESEWETTGGGDPADVPTAIRNVANLWCGHATTLAAEDITLDYDLPDPAHNDDDPRAAALGLAAIYMGTDNVRSENIPMANISFVEDAMDFVL